jgi:hypothetical protein
MIFQAFHIRDVDSRLVLLSYQTTGLDDQP